MDYVLTFRHPEGVEVLFPDSTFDFSPFEWVGQRYFPTRTDAEGSFDSVVYTLRTFELDSVQRLALPVWEIQGKEQRKASQPEEDWITLEHVLLTVPDSAELQANTRFLPVLTGFNYPYLLVGLGGLCVLVVLTVVLFGKRIRKAYRLRKMKREHQKFQKQFNTFIDSTLDTPTITHALAQWKNYTAKMTDLPLYSYTTKEMSAILADTQLSKQLPRLDLAMYADIREGDLSESLRYLREYALSAYQQKAKEVQNA